MGNSHETGIINEKSVTKMIAITGASGFIGSQLTQVLTASGHNVMPLSRYHFSDEGRTELEAALARADVVINLAGASIRQRWTASHKQALINSRVHVTQRLVEVINGLSDKPELVISASAVGYYAQTGCHDEEKFEKATDFLASVCEQWEGAIAQLDGQVRLAITRFGVVMDQGGGAFPSMALPSKLKVSTVIGSGKQAFSWIALTDLIRAMQWIMADKTLSGVFNFTTPTQLNNQQTTQLMATHFGSWLTIHLPAALFKLIIGEGATVITSGQCVLPKRLLDAGFVFQYPTFESFLASLD